MSNMFASIFRVLICPREASDSHADVVKNIPSDTYLLKTAKWKIIIVHFIS